MKRSTLTFLLLFPGALLADSLIFKDSRGNEIVFPQGEISFADRVVSYEIGSPKPVEAARNPATATGIPDYVEGSPDGSDYVCLGHDGVLTLAFDDNVLIDVDGLDLYVFEIGPNVEATLVEISEDGRDWTEVGKASGSLSGIDIAPRVKSGQVFRFVRLRDDPGQGNSSGSWPGADIDAIGAIGSALRFNLEGSVLFDFDESTLKVDARLALEGTIAKINERGVASIRLEGHTDDRGSNEYNRSLSERRALAVAQYFIAQGLSEDSISAVGFGESRPIATNDTDEGRATNRRVEVIVVTK